MSQNPIITTIYNNLGGDIPLGIIQNLNNSIENQLINTRWRFTL